MLQRADAAAFEPVAMLTENAAKVLTSRYLDRDESGITETPMQLFQRVAKHIARGEPDEIRDEWETKFLNATTHGAFMPNSPTLMNAGRRLGMLSACQPYHALVLTVNGYRPIGEIVEAIEAGLTVTVSNGQGEWVDVLAVKRSGIRDVQRVYLSHGRYFDATADHLISTCRTDGHSKAKFDWAEVQHMEPGDYVQYGQQPATQQFSAAPNAEIALAGWLLTDGGAGMYPQSSGVGEFFVGEVQTVDSKSLDHVVALFDNLAIRYSIRCDPDVNVEQFSRVRSNDRKLLDLCERFEVMARREGKHICDLIKRADGASRCEFLRVVFEADGCINSQGFIGFQSISEVFVRDIQEMLDCFGISSSIVRKNDPRENRSDGWHLAIAHNTDVLTFRGCLGFISDRKIARLAAVAEKRPYIRKLRVELVETFSREEVFDIQTATHGDGTYVTNGVLVHNCFVLPVPDDVHGIFQSVEDTAMIQKAGGGVGFAFDELRPCGAFISTSGGQSSGPISFWRVFYEATNAIQQGCVVGSTLVATPSGVKSIQELVGSRPWVFTFNSDKNRIAVARASSVFKTKVNAEVWKLTTDKGLELYATPDHLILGRDGVDRPLSSLVPGMSLMPLTRYTKGKRDVLVTLQDGEDTRMAQHRLVYADTRGLEFSAMSGLDVHHKNRDHFDDDPDNLELLSRSEHIRDHGFGDDHANFRVNRYPQVGSDNGMHASRFFKEKSQQDIDDYRRRVSAGLSANRRVSAGLSANNPMKKSGVAKSHPLFNSPYSKRLAKRGKAVAAVATLYSAGADVSTPDAWSSSRNGLPNHFRYKAESLLELFGSWDELLGHVYRRATHYTSPRAAMLSAYAAMVNAGFDPNSDADWDSALRHFPEFSGKKYGSKSVRSVFGSVVELSTQLRASNHRVVSVEFSHCEDVYDMTVPAGRHFAVVSSAAKDAGGIVVHNSFRRGANMAMMRVSHPDIIKFLFAKQDLRQFTNYNISVKVDDEFMRQVKEEPEAPLVVSWKDKSWLVPSEMIARCRAAVLGDDPRGLDVCYRLSDLVSTDSPDIVSTDFVTVGDVFDLITDNAWKTGEPGLCFHDRIKEFEALPDVAPINATNPCVTGDTLVAVADGRGCVPIVELAESGNTVPVHCVDPKTGEPHVRLGKAPRKTRSQVSVVKVTLDDGSFIRTTPDHKFLLRSGAAREAQELRAEDSLLRFGRYQQPNTTRQGMYWQVLRSKNHGVRGQYPEHNMVCRAIHGAPPEEGDKYLPHHKNHDSLDNRPENLEWLERGEHNLIHPEISDRAGEKNGMFGRKQSAASNAKNGAKTRKRFENDAAFRQKHSEAMTRAMANPETREKLRQACLGEQVTRACGQCGTEKTFPKYMMDKKTKDGKPFYCSHACAHLVRRLPISKDECVAMAHECTDKYDKLTERTWGRYGADNSKRPSVNTLKRIFGSFQEFKDAALAVYNHKVVSVEPDGVEDVYNITVDEFHTVAYVTNPDGKTRSKGYPNHKGIYTPQCGEEPLPPHSSCNLGSVNLGHFVTPFYEAHPESRGINLSSDDRERLVDWTKLEQAVELGVRFLDNVVTENNFPTAAIREMADKERRIGLGVMGFADALIRLGVRYDSESGLSWGKRFMQFVNQVALRYSQQLAEERGAFPLYEESRWHKGDLFERFDVEPRPLRNVCTTTCAPTGTISIISDCSGGIEPWFSFAFTRQVLNGEKMMEVNEDFRNVAKLWGFDDPSIYEQLLKHGSVEKLDVPIEAKDIFRGAQDISPAYHVRMQAEFQRHVTSAVSKTINLPYDVSVDDVRAAYLLAGETGCKGVTVYRDGSRSMQPMALNSSEDRKRGADEVLVVPDGERFRDPIELPEMLPSVRTRYRSTYGSLHIHVSLEMTPDGRYREREVFFDVGRGGDGVKNAAEVFARLSSMILRLDGRMDVIIDQLKGHGSCGEARNHHTGAETSMPNEMAMGLLEYFKSAAPFRDDEGFLTQVPSALQPVPIKPPLAGGNGVHMLGDRSQAFIKRVMNEAAMVGTLQVPCPSGCGGMLVHAEGCRKCYNCGHSTCG